MKICGIVCEYNPFHLGHRLHIQKIREQLAPDYIIAVMSGNFTQRGDVALFDKWVRTRAALQCGIDLVIELPFISAVQSAEGFAQGAVSLLHSAGCTHLSFGCENPDLPLLTRFASFLLDEPKDFSRLLKYYLDNGFSFPKARGAALSSMFELPVEQIEPLLVSSNNILALEYLKAIQKIGSAIIPYPIQRQGLSYNDDTIDPSCLCSALAIRKEFAAHGLSKDVLSNVPKESAQEMKAALEGGMSPMFNEALFPLLQYKVRTMSTKQLGDIYEVSEGLEHKIKKAVGSASSYEELILEIKSKRYALTRIKRILLYILFDITKSTAKRLMGVQPYYLRLLGFRKASEALLGHIAQFSNLPLVTQPLNFKDKHKSLELDVLATDIYMGLQPKPKPPGLDYSHKFVIA